MTSVRDRAGRRRWVPVITSGLAYLVGLVDVVSAITPAFRDRVRLVAQYLPGVVRHSANAGTLVAGVALVLLAHGLRRRKRRAWVALVALLAVSVVLNIVKALDVEEALLSGVVLVVAAGLREEFQARGDPRSRRLAAVVLCVLLAADVAIGFGLLAAHQRAVVGHPGLGSQLQQIVYGLAGVAGPLSFRSDHVSDLITFALGGVGVLTLSVTAYLVLRPYAPVGEASPEDQQRVRDLLARHGSRDSLGYFALRHDKSVIFSESGKAAIAYRVVSGVMLSSGDPIGDPEAWPGAIAAFVRLADRHAWVPAVMGCSELAGQVWARQAGLDVLELGDEAIVEVDEFTLDGRGMRNVRQMVNRVERVGYTTTVARVRDLTDSQVAHVRAAAAVWRGSQTERGFSMALGRLGEREDGDCVVAMAHDGRGELRAVLHFAPWGSDGLSLDVMRRDRAADPGLNELLIVAALRAAPGLGVGRVSLNFAMFRAALARGERLGAGPVLRCWCSLLLFTSRWFQIESLYRFNAKFRPIWEPRFFCYPRAADLPRVGFAAMRAEAFIVSPVRAVRHAVSARPARSRPAEV